jgi:biotin operon repressor
MQELTLKQRQVLDLYNEHKSSIKVSEILGISDRNVRKVIDTCRKKGYAGSKPQPTYEIGQRTGYEIGKVTTHVQHSLEGGVVKNEWIRQYPTEKDLEQFTQYLEQRVEGKATAIKPPKYKDTDLSIWLPIGDPHFGMYAWAKEAGEDYDVDIAVSVHEQAIRKLLSVREMVDCIYICSLGDLLHADSRRAETEKSKHLLDVDGRFWRVIDMTTECLCRAIEFAATKAKKVKVILLAGNHDPHASGHISRTLSAYYRSSKQIEINTSPAKHIYEEYGNNLVGLVHGDTSKMPSLPAVMSCDMREAWGRTRNHYWFTGHIHQQKVFEYPSCVVESFNSLTAKDSYAAEYGYRSRRQMTSVVIHKEHGEVERAMVRPEHFL